MLDFFLNIDFTIFNFVNQSLSAPLLDNIVPWFRNRFLWVPLYVFLAVLTVVQFRSKSYIILVSAVLVVLICDQVSSSFIKPNIQRTRPCNNVELQAQVRVLAPCRNSFSFTSSHATNHFGVATFFALLFSSLLGRKRYLLFFWAGLVSISQVYVGLHFPADILVGGIIGCLLGSLVFSILSKYYLSDNVASV